MPKKVKIRIAVLVDEKGTWHAAGETGERDDSKFLEAEELLVGNHPSVGECRRAYILTATIEAACKTKAEVVEATTEEVPYARED